MLTSRDFCSTLLRCIQIVCSVPMVTCKTVHILFTSLVLLAIQLHLREHVTSVTSYKCSPDKLFCCPSWDVEKGHWQSCYIYQPQEELYLHKTSNALPVTHCIAQRAFDYHKRSSVLRVTTSDWRVFLLQAPYGLCNMYSNYCHPLLQISDRDATMDDCYQ